MQKVISELFILMTNLSQVKNSGRVISLYIEGLNEIIPEHTFIWNTGTSTNENHIIVCSRSKNYGFVTCQPKIALSTDIGAFLINSGQLLATILDNLEKTVLILKQQDLLKDKIDKQTISLITKQDELNEINEEYASLNEELLSTNLELLKTNNRLEQALETNKKYTTELKKSEAFFKNIFNHAAVGKTITTINGKIEVNDAFCEMLGYSKKELSTLNWEKITHPDDIAKCKEHTDALLNGSGSKRTWKKRYIHKDGSIVWVNISTTLMRDENNNPQYFITTANDITKLINIQAQLGETNQFFKGLFDHSNSAIMVWDDCFIITHFNSAFENISGYKASEVIGKNMDVLFSMQSIDFALEYLAQTHEGIPLKDVEIEITTKNGNKRFLVWNTAPILNEYGTHTSTVAQGTDITELKNVLRKVQIAENRLANIIDGTRAGTWEWNIQTGETIFNETWANTFGYTLKELSPLSISTWIDLAHPEDLITSNSLLDKHFKGELPYYESETRMKHKNGQWIWVLNRGKVTSRDEDGNPILMYGTHKDITERKNAELALIDSENLLNESQRISKIGSYKFYINENKWQASQILHEIFEINDEYSHTIEGWQALIHPDDKEIMADHLKNEVLTRKHLFDKEYRIITAKTKSVKWIHGFGKLELDHEDKPYRLIGTIQDITERKKVMNDLAETNELLSRFILNSPIYTYIKEVTPKESKVIKASENFIDMIGIPGSQMIGKNMHELFPKEFADKITNDDWEVVSKGETLSLEEDLSDKHYTTLKFPIKLGSRNLLAGYTIDITARKRAEIMAILKNEELTIANNKLKKAKEKAEESDRLKSSFLANMSHEIRTPLNSIMGFASLLPEEEEKELIDQYSTIIVQNSEQLLSIIDGIVLYSKLQTGLLKCRPVSFALKDLFTDIVQSFNLPEFKQNVVLKVEFPDEVNLTIHNDYDKLRQILTNLITNAFKYTLKGEIICNYTTHKKYIKFKIKDTGIGIPSKDKMHIFERFYRGTNIDLAGIRGTGLGLSIVKELVGLLGGEIGVTSIEGKGTTFYFTISRDFKG